MSNLTCEELNRVKAKKIISELVKSGVRTIVLAPGSGSTPLVLAVADNPLIESIVHFDERGVAFHALGIAKGSGRPTALLCTSGTAVANFYPAIIEASQSNIPLIILTADRPPELRDVGANQVIDQVKIFGNFIRFEVDLPCPDPSISDEVIATTVNQAVYRAVNGPAGPVQINAMFRDPYGIYANPKRFDESKSPLPHTTYHTSNRALSAEQIRLLAANFSKYEKGLIVVGNLPADTCVETIVALAMKLQWPIFADPLSGLRSIGRDSAIIPYYNHILQTTPSSERMRPEVILHLGGPLVSKTLLTWISTLELKRYYLVHNTPKRIDPKHKVTDRIEMKADLFASLISDVMPRRNPSLWVGLWKEYSLNVEAILEEFFVDNPSLSELGTIKQLERSTDESVSYYLGNSLPVRYFDTFFFPKEPSGLMYGNRGASGIDGNIATALGIAKGRGEPLIAVIGDLTFLHDLNSLALAQPLPFPVVLIVLNNFGGGIFQFLPIAEHKEHFENHFQLQHTISIEPFVKGFQLQYHRPEDVKSLQGALDEALNLPGLSVIEVMTDSKENFAFHQKVDEVLRKKMGRGKRDKELCYYTKK